jgi:hypothetical protein
VSPYDLLMTAKERLLRAVDQLTEQEAASARIVVEFDGNEDAESNMAELPEGWNRTVSGRPMPDIVAALDRSRAER